MPPPKLHDYQQVGAAHLWRNPGAGLFMDCGLGKTATTLSALHSDQLPALVVAPKRVCEQVWPAEAKLWRPDLTLRVAVGTPTRRAQILATDADIHVISRDNLADALKFKGRWKTLIIDELSGFKSPKSIRFRTAKKLRTSVENVWGLTGTPSPNGLLDLWAQIYLLDGGERLGSTLGAYRGRYFTPGWVMPNGVVTSWNIRPGAAARIHALIEDICISMSVDRLPIAQQEPLYNRVAVPLPSTALRVYKSLKDDLVADLSLIGGELHTASNSAVLSSKLAQVTAGFLYVDDADIRDGAYQELHREKVSAIREIIDGTGSPILLFYRFKAEAEIIRQAFPELVHTIDEPDILDRWNAGDVPILMAHPASAGHGLNLQHGGHTIIWSSLPWSLEEWEQANARLARQGQKHPVVVHILTAPKTIDDDIRAALINKTSVQDALLAHLESPI